jgi:hypothetical protein
MTFSDVLPILVARYFHLGIPIISSIKYLKVLVFYINHSAFTFPYIQSVTTLLQVNWDHSLEFVLFSLHLGFWSVTKSLKIPSQILVHLSAQFHLHHPLTGSSFHHTCQATNVCFCHYV